jgi:triacylglycerol lipase
MPLDLKSRQIVFVHGIFGWGANELPLSYWGEALAQFAPTRFETHEVKCGPVSSFHDRACELFAQIKGGDFIYGKTPDAAKRAVVPRGERKHVTGPLLPDWSANNPVILVGHSAGAHTCLALQRLLRDDFFGVGSNADWIEAVICISGVLNGSTLTYGFGCDPVTGILTKHPERLVGATVEIANRVPKLPLAGIELWLEQWIDQDAFVKGKDNLAYDLTLVGCQAANAAFSTNPNTYYLSLVTSMPPGLPKLPGIPLPELVGGINLLLEGSAIYQAEVVNFVPPALPLANWETTPELQIDAWRENDGAVSAISQRFPFTHHSEPFGREGFFDGAPVQKGKWYFELVKKVIGKRFDHLDPAFGAAMKGNDVVAAQRELYQKLAALL